MNDEVKAWLDRAHQDLKIARLSFDAAEFEPAAYQAQQAAEKTFKDRFDGFDALPIQQPKS